MKKISLLLALMMVLSAFTFMNVSASAFYINELGDISMPIATPTVDGTISAGEGWSQGYSFNTDTAAPFWAHNAMTSTGTMYFAYSAEGIYFAVDMNELNHLNCPNQNGDLTDYDGNTFVYSTGLDNVNPDVTEVRDEVTGEFIRNDYSYDYGWNGDIVSLMIDPNGALLAAGYSGNNDYTPWYNVGLFDNGEAKMYRSKVNEGELVPSKTGVQCAGKAKEDMAGVVIEAFVPWSVICQDISDLSFGDVNISVDEISAIGYKCKAAIMYMDRFNDPEAGKVDTWGRWITVCARTFDGTPGPASSGSCLKSLGLTLVNGADNPFTDVLDNKWYTKAALWCNAKGYITGTSETTFNPMGKLNRAMFVQILAKVAGADLSKITYTAKFTDVPDNKWYTKAVLWAADKGVTGGIGNGCFGPLNPVTRQQLATFLYTYCNIEKIDVSKVADITNYTDYSAVASWAKTPLAWAVKVGLISSTSTVTKTLTPNGVATRAQAAVIIKALCENVLVK